jgi:hypothetical protein
MEDTTNIYGKYIFGIVRRVWEVNRDVGVRD